MPSDSSSLLTRFVAWLAEEDLKICAWKEGDCGGPSYFYERDHDDLVAQFLQAPEPTQDTVVDAL